MFVLGAFPPPPHLSDQTQFPQEGDEEDRPTQLWKGSRPPNSVNGLRLLRGPSPQGRCQQGQQEGGRRVMPHPSSKTQRRQRANSQRTH